MNSLPPQAAQSPSSFEEILRSVPLPEPGPEYYAARRRLWLTPRQESVTPPLRSPTRQRLEDAFNQPGAIYDPTSWNSGLEKVWKSISSGAKMKYPMPMNILIKIIHASWLRDKTWPVGMEVPTSDEEQQLGDHLLTTSATSNAPVAAQTTPMPIITPSDIVENTPPPWSSVHRRGR